MHPSAGRTGELITTKGQSGGICIIVDDQGFMAVANKPRPPVVPSDSVYCHKSPATVL